MHRFLVFLALCMATACSKISQSSLQGEWTVESIQVREITSTTDSGWKSQLGAANVFIVGESLIFESKHILPCPSADAILRKYDDYEGRISYKLLGDRLSIPESHFSYLHTDGEIAEAGEITLRATNFDVICADGGLLVLSEQYRDTDLLGNVRKELDTKVQLLRKGDKENKKRL